MKKREKSAALRERGKFVQNNADADRALKDFVSKFRSRLIPDDLSATGIAGLNHGHRQTTDSCLAMLAKHHGIKFAALEEALAMRFPEVPEWVQ